MKNLKILIFLEIVAMLVTAMIHLISYLCEEEFPLIYYAIASVVILLSFLLSVFIFAPIADFIL